MGDLKNIVGGLAIGVLVLVSAYAAGEHEAYLACYAIVGFGVIGQLVFLGRGEQRKPIDWIVILVTAGFFVYLAYYLYPIPGDCEALDVEIAELNILISQGDQGAENILDDLIVKKIKWKCF